MQTENSSTLDADTYGSALEVRKIFSQHCTPCHAFQGMSVDALVTAGLLVKGNALNSKIYYRLVGSAGSSGPKNMPSTGSISASDVANVYDWVQGLN